MYGKSPENTSRTPAAGPDRRPLPHSPPKFPLTPNPTYRHTIPRSPGGTVPGGALAGSARLSVDGSRRIQRPLRVQGCPAREHPVGSSATFSVYGQAPYSFRPGTMELDVALTIPANVLGVIVSGDLADYTIYTDRHGRKVPFPKSPPKEPPSPRQVQQRERFRLAQAAWSALTPQQKADLELATQHCSLALTGQNLYIALALRTNQELRETVARQSGIDLPTIPFVGFPPTS